MHAHTQIIPSLNLGHWVGFLNLGCFVHMVSTFKFNVIQVYTGAYRKQSRTDVREVQDLAGLKIDQLLAVRSCPSSNIEPWIAQLRSISDSEVGVVWMEGKYNSKWKVARRQDPENKRKRIEWEDSVTKSSILLYDFQLTSTGHLRKKTIEHLKSVYQELKQSNT